MVELSEPVLQTNWFKRRRAERLRREIALLEGMDWRVWRMIVICGSLTILAVTVGFVAVGYALHVHFASIPIAFAICLGFASLLYFVSRFKNGLYWLYTVILIAVVIGATFYDSPIADIPDLTWSSDGGAVKDRKSARRAKIQNAIQRRKLKLGKLLVQLQQ
jgi:hypothetical protein